MYAMKATFDGCKVVMPTIPPVHKCSVIIIFEEKNADMERQDWQDIQNVSLSNVWLNEEDAVYDTL